MKIKTKQNGGFTLVELLVVIAIIAILAALSTPAIMGALKKSKIVKASGVCKSFEVAVNNFENEYNYLPFGGGGNAPSADDETIRSDDDIVAVLAGREEDLNFKQIRFFELTKPKGSAGNYKDGLHIDGATAELYDAWGETYYISIDYDLDGELDDPFGGADKITGKKCLIFSTGPDKLKGSTKLNKDNPKNF